MIFFPVLAMLAAAAPENVYRGELVAYPGPWGLQLGKQAIILVTDEELEALRDPDRVLNLSTGRTPRNASLRQICERAQAAGQRKLEIAFDHFFKQYRPGTDKPRRLMPEMDAYIQRIAAIGKFAAGYGLGLELSLLSPLEVGKSFPEPGKWMHYRKGVRDPKTGAFSVQLWRQQRWVNNKGPIDIADAGVRVFAFRQTAVSGTPYRVVDPKEIVEIKTGTQVEVYPNLSVKSGDYIAQRVRVYGRSAEGQGLDRVMVVQQYRTPEMDYFSAKALPFLTGLVDRYLAAGVKLGGLYSDEMHIQGDWAYFNHHDNGEFAVRYISDGLAREYAARFGAEYKDFAKYLVYFIYGQEDTATDLSARQGIMHVFGASPQEIRRTALFRARYYKLLQDGVVDLFVKAKHYTEQKIGYRLDARYHATWAQSPTIDFWDTGRANRHPSMYEYTSNFVWSNTVHQAATACYDYFKWGEFMTGGGNDHTEGGWLDRDYYALSLASSTGIINDVPYSYAAHWGMPQEISRRRTALASAYGASAAPPFAMVQEMQHRDSEVLMLYPLDLVAVEERFGSWMSQYGYANMITASKLVEMGKVEGEVIRLGGRRFTTLIAQFEPFPSKKLLAMMREYLTAGGRVVWSGPPPVLTAEGDDALSAWREMFGVDYEPGPAEGLAAPGKEIHFEGELPPQTILTDFLVDRIYPVTPRPGTFAFARVKDAVVGTKRGNATFAGFRPRDDQSQSLGYDSHTWFDLLSVLGAYSFDDNTERVSRTTNYFAARFPNGATSIAPHLKLLEEGWEGGFSRNPETDRAYLATNPPPSESLDLKEFKVNGHTVTYDGTGAVCFRLDKAGQLIAFAGNQTNRIVVDDRETVFADRPMAQIAWAPVAAERRVPGGAVLQLQVRGEGTVTIPGAQATGLHLYAEGAKPGSKGAVVPTGEGDLSFKMTPEIQGRWLYLAP